MILKLFRATALNSFLVGAFSLKKKSPTITVGSFLVGAFSLKEKSPAITVGSFLVGAFSLKEKSPTITVSIFFLFQLTISLWMVHFLQFSWSTNCHTCNFYWHLAGYGFFWGMPSRRTWVRVQPWPKIFLCKFFSALWYFFSQIFLMSPKGPPSFFPILQKNGFSKTPKGPPPFTFFGTMRLIGDQKNFEKILKKNFKKFGIFFQFFPHAGTVEENTWHI